MIIIQKICFTLHPYSIVNLDKSINVLKSLMLSELSHLNFAIFLKCGVGHIIVFELQFYLLSMKVWKI